MKMVAEIQPNRWYTMYQVFGDSLFALDSHWTAEDDGQTRLEKGIQQIIKALFKGSNFTLNLDYEQLSMERTQTSSGKLIYYPVGAPTLGDIQGVFQGDFRIRRYVETSFSLDNVLAEDLIGQPYMMKDTTSKGPIQVQAYRYHLLLKSGKGVFISEEPASFNSDANSPFVDFLGWHPIDSQEIGRLYLPLEYEKVAPSEIMLKEK